MESAVRIDMVGLALDLVQPRRPRETTIPPPLLLSLDLSEAYR